MKIHIVLVGNTNKYRNAFSNININPNWELEFNEVSDIYTKKEKALNDNIDLLIISAKNDEKFWRYIKNIKSAFKNLEIILLSKTPDFNTAYQAFQYRVSNFLLEPVEEETWSNIIYELLEKRLIIETTKEKEEKLLSYELGQHQKLMARIMTQMMENPEELSVMMGEINERYHMNLIDSYYFAVQITFLDLMETSHKEKVLKEIQEVFEYIMTLSNEIIASSQFDIGLRVIININWDYHTPEIMEQLREIEKEIIVRMSKYKMDNWAMSIGPVVQNIHGIQLSVQASIEAVHNWNYKKDEHFFVFDDNRKNLVEDNEILDNMNKRQCQKLLRQFNVATLQGYLWNFIYKYESKVKIKPFTIQLLVIEVVELAYEVWKNKFELIVLENILCKDIFQYIYDNNKKITYLIRLLTSLAEKQKDKPVLSVSPQIRAAINFIHENYKQGLSLDKVALEVDLSPNYFSNLFREETGSNYLDYVTEFRLNLSRQMLEEKDWTIEKIANEIGYQDVKYFSQLFKRQYKITPGKYRKSNITKE